MPVPMQGEKLLPGQQDIVASGIRLHAPHRRRGDGARDALPDRVVAPGGKLRMELLALGRPVMGENIDQHAFDLLRVGVAELDLRKLLQVLVQKPRVVEHRLEDQRLAPRNGAARPAQDRARGEVRAEHDIGLPAGERLDRRRATPSPSLAVLPRGPAPAKAALAPGRRRLGAVEQALEPARQILAVVPTNRLVADGADDLPHAGLERRAPLGRVEPALLALAQPEHFGERAGGCDYLGDRLAEMLWLRESEE